MNWEVAKSLKTALYSLNNENGTDESNLLFK